MQSKLTWRSNTWPYASVVGSWHLSAFSNKQAMSILKLHTFYLELGSWIITVWMTGDSIGRADLDTTYIHSKPEFISRYPIARPRSFHFGNRLSLTPSYHPSNSHSWTLKWKLTSTIPARQGRGEVMKLLIIIRGRWRTEGLAKEMERVMRLWEHSRRGCRSGRGLRILGGWTRLDHRDRAGYQSYKDIV